mmetsp:Transcript_34917/g.33213  ORF Transcript_34917/g.33213 Transcript_34917/m.33213 type:complete len:321 (-) Transcript_34917:63-1025(-)
MGNGPSQDEVEKVGYRVLGVQPNSPAAQGGLVSFFDFIVAAQGVNLRTLDGTFIDIIKGSEDKPLPLTVYNWKSRTFREVILVPSRRWPGEGMLGVTIRFDSYHDAEEHLCRITEVEADSPAELAGLCPFKDYLLGTAEKVFRDTDVLYEEVAANVEAPIEFYVYNSDSDEVRIAVVMPSDQWGGEGLLGAGVAQGFLHGLPSDCCNTIGISNITATKSLGSPFGYNDCQPEYQSSSSSHDMKLTEGGYLQSENQASNGSNGNGSTQYISNQQALFNGDKIEQSNQFYQYSIPTPPLPPHITPQQAPTTIDITLKPPPGS